MTRALRAVLPCLAIVPVVLFSEPLAAQAQRSPPDTAQIGFPIDDATTIARCSSCHARDEKGRLGRISYMRKTPEGWQTSVRRMVSLNDVELTPDEARSIVRYLSNELGLAPEELKPGRFEVERRMIDHDYADDDTENACVVCHSMGRVITQRRTREEWGLLLATHRALYPLVDFQAFRRGGPPPTEPGPRGEPPDARHPMDKAIAHLASAYPLQTAEWSAWRATKRPPRLEGTWLLTGHEPGRGALFGTVTITPSGTDGDAFRTETRAAYAETGAPLARTGQAIVYTGYQWRGRSTTAAESDELREVMAVDRDRRSMSGRWFTGAYDEVGPDITLRRVGREPVLAGAHPYALARGAQGVALRVFGANLPGSATAADFDFGAGVRVTAATAGPGDAVDLTLDIAADAPLGGRDLFAAGAALTDAIVVHDGIHRIEVTPQAGMARVGGGNFPAQLQVFDAIGWNNGPDGRPDTKDDLRLGRVPVTWSIEEYAATFGDDDVAFVGSIDASGRFTPALDGPNPERRGDRNNIGDVWVVATLASTDDVKVDKPVRARAHLLVTVPLYARFDPWKEIVR